MSAGRVKRCQMPAKSNLETAGQRLRGERRWGLIAGPDYWQARGRIGWFAFWSNLGARWSEVLTPWGIGRASAAHAGCRRGRFVSHRHRDNSHLGWSASQFAAYCWACMRHAAGASVSAGRSSMHELGADWRQKTSTRAVIHGPFSRGRFLRTSPRVTLAEPTAQAEPPPREGGDDRFPTQVHALPIG